MLTLGLSHSYRGLICRNRPVPESQHEEDVRGHVLRVRGCGRDLGVAPGRPEAKRGVHRVVIGMD
jgi:hypothetical protein